MRTWTEENVNIEIKDEGMGMDETLQLIFEKFYREQGGMFTTLKAMV